MKSSEKINKNNNKRFFSPLRTIYGVLIFNFEVFHIKFFFCKINFLKKINYLVARIPDPKKYCPLNL